MVGSRLAYEPLTADHAQALFPALADPAIYRYIDEQPPTSIEELARRIERINAGPPADRADERWWNYAVRLIRSDRLIGQIQATIVYDRAEVAYLFDPAYWGQGYATEAMAWLHRQLCEQTSVNAFWATTLPENSRSIGLLHRLNYVRMDQWPVLMSYEPGDIVFRRPAAAVLASRL